MGRLPPGSTPAERRLKPGCVSRTAAAVAPVGQPDEALGTVLGQGTTTMTIAFVAIGSFRVDAREASFVVGAMMRRAATPGAKVITRLPTAPPLRPGRKEGPTANSARPGQALSVV